MARPPTIRAGGVGRSPIRARDVTLFPHPDSPTMHSVLPFDTENDTSSTTLMSLGRAIEAHRRILDRQKGSAHQPSRRCPILPCRRSSKADRRMSSCGWKSRRWLTGSVDRSTSSMRAGPAWRGHDPKNAVRGRPRDARASQLRPLPASREAMAATTRWCWTT